MYVLDTNTLIYFFKGLGGVAEKLLAISPRDIAIPSVVMFELEYGIQKSTSPDKRRAQLKQLASLVKELPFGRIEAQAAAIIRAQLDVEGTPIGAYDVLIAATAQANNGVLVTNNTREFARVSDLKLANWFTG